LLLIPGPAVLYIVTRSVDQGRRAGLASSSGIATGTLAHVLAAALGLSALLVSSAVAYSVVKYAGAAYLFYLGVKKFRERPATANELKHVQALPLRRVYAQGVLVNVLNPKTAIFFFAFLPQFVNPARGYVSGQFLALGMLFTLVGLTTDSVWALTAGSAAGWLRTQSVLYSQPAIGLRNGVFGLRHGDGSEWIQAQVSCQPQRCHKVAFRLIRARSSKVSSIRFALGLELNHDRRSLLFMKRKPASIH
jgi:threonine/homoserine/homoserine lactone efflux protein